jgi:hypothetical protein
MVAAMRDMLTKAGVDEDDIRTEDFPGYLSRVMADLCTLAARKNLKRKV